MPDAQIHEVMMDAHDMNVLLVEDSPSDVEFVRAALAEDNGIAFHVSVVNRLSDALTRLHQAKVDAVLVDLGLPDCQGLTTVQQLYQVCGSDTTIVVLTGNEDEDLGSQALQLGAQDFLNKKHLSNSRALTRCLRFGRERTLREVLERQFVNAQRGLEVARAIQEHLLPRQAPRFPGFDIAGVCCPADATGGDFFDFIPMANGRLGIVLADVAGHGFGPALIMAGTRRTLRMIAKANSAPATILALVNEAVFEDTEAEHFVTLFLASLDPDRTFTYAGAGHNAHRIDLAGAVTVLDATGMPLGVMNDCVYEGAGPLPLAAGHMLLLVSDGVHEALPNNGGLPFGLPAVYDYIRIHRDLPARTIVDGLIRAVKQFCSPAIPRDDMTVVLVKSICNLNGCVPAEHR